MSFKISSSSCMICFCQDTYVFNLNLKNYVEVVERFRGESHVLVAQSCPALCNSVVWSPPESSVHGILQARILGWVAISCSKREPEYLGEKLLLYNKNNKDVSYMCIYVKQILPLFTSPQRVSNISWFLNGFKRKTQTLQLMMVFIRVVTFSILHLQNV